MSLVRCCAMGLLLVLLGACGEQEEDAGGPLGGAPRAVVVDAEPVERLELAPGVQVLGELEAVDRVALGAEIAGRVARLAVAEGETVVGGERDGSVVAELERELVELAVAEAEAELAVRERAVAQQELLTRRARELHERQAGTEADFLDAQADLHRRQAARDRAEAALQSARARLRRTTIRAPFDAVVGEHLVSPGAYVSPGQPLLELVRLDPVDCRFTVSEDYAGRLREGLSVRVRLPALGDAEVAGEIGFVAPVVHGTTRMLLCKAHLANPERRLQPGMSAQVRVALEEERGILAVSESAIVPRSQTASLYVVEDGKAARREVRVGERLPGKAVIAEGLDGDEIVITAGLQRVGDGVPVQVRGAGAEGREAQGASAP